MLRFVVFLGIAARCIGADSTSVILISVDTLRADHLSAYGYRRIRTPHIDALADHGTVYTRVESQIPLTLPSHTSLLTSTYPFENGIQENAQRVPPAMTLASVLKSQGYRTAAFIGSVFLESEMGLDQGFDLYDSPFHFEAFSPISGSMFFGGLGRNPYTVRDRRDGALVLGAARRWLAAHGSAPVFAFVHLFDLHQPYIRGGYDAELAYVDNILGGFQQALVQSGMWQRSLVVFLSDHGEGLGEHGEDSHGYFIYESTLWVPLIIHWPGGAASRAARNSQPAGLIDVAPTILDYLHVNPPSSFAGRSLLAGGGDEPVYSESVYAYDSFGWAPLRSIRQGAYKYIDAPRPELYDLHDDHGELNNLASKEPARARVLANELHALIVRHAPTQPATPGNIPPRTRALLASLGYLSGGPKAANGSQPADPKDKLYEYRLYERAQMALARKQLQDAAIILRQLLARDPHNLLARRDLGGTYVELKQYEKARACFEDVVVAAPDDYMAQFELGVVYRRLGSFKEALEHLGAACRLAPQAAQCTKELEETRRESGGR